MMGGRVSAVMIAGSISGPCMSSKMRPMVHAVVSLTYGWGSCMACTTPRRNKSSSVLQSLLRQVEGLLSLHCPPIHTCSKKANACLTVSKRPSGSGPSRTRPNANVEASLSLQSSGVVFLLTLAWTNGNT